MWTRNVMFVAGCALGLTLLGATLQPLHSQAERRKVAINPPAEDLTALVKRIDASFRLQWTQQQMLAPARADDLTIARRLSLALTGSIPSLEEVRLLEAEPPPARVLWWLEGLLADRRSADYLAERLARATVGVQDGPFIIFRRRRFVSWLADQLSENRPYDQIVREMLEATGLWTDRPATNFITVTIKPDLQLGPDENELTARVARAFLGVRLDCAQCHDHPFQPWKQSDFQGLAAYFGPTEQKFTGIHDDPQGKYEVENRLTGKTETVSPRVPFQPELLPQEGSSRHRLAVWVTHPQNKAFGRAMVNRAWAILFGRPLVEPIDGAALEEIGPAAVDLLAEDFVSHGYDLRRLIRAIALTEVFAADSRAGQNPDGTDGFDVTARHEAAWAIFPITRLRPEQVAGGLLQAASLTTIDYGSHILTRTIRAATVNDFVTRYGDAGEDEFAPQAGNIPQRLLMMNGSQIFERTKENIVLNAATRIAVLAPDDGKAVEVAFLTALTRRPTAVEMQYFTAVLADRDDKRSRNQRLEDLCWTLLNSTEFAWNH